MAARSPGSFEELAIEFVQAIKVSVKDAAMGKADFRAGIVGPIGLEVEEKPASWHFKGFDEISEEYVLRA